MTPFAILLVLTTTAPPPPSDAPPAVALQVDVSALPDDGVTEDLKSFLIGYQTEVIADAGLAVETAADTTIRIRVSLYGEGDIHMRADVVLLDKRNDASQTMRTVLCELCSDGDLVVRVGQEVSALTTQVLYPPLPVQDTPSLPEEASPLPPPIPDAPPDTADAPKAIGGLGYVGIAALVTGVGTLAGGIPLSLRPDDIRPGGIGAQRRNTRPAGIALSAVGGILLASGAMMISFDVLHRKKQRRISLHPQLSPSGLALTTRF